MVTDFFDGEFIAKNNKKLVIGVVITIIYFFLKKNLLD